MRNFVAEVGRPAQASIAIKSAACIIPGFGDGSRFGELLPTRELFDNMTRASSRSPRIGSNFVALKLGIESVATSQTTLDICRKLWATRARAANAARYAGYTNESLYDLLEASIRRALAPGGERPSLHVRAHIHVITAAQPMLEHELIRIRRAIGIDHEDLHSLIIQQGCAGLFSALKTARTLLASDECSAHDVVLVTAENNMMPYVHQRSTDYADAGDIDSWLFPAIFGEGAGALILGRVVHTPATPEWRIEAMSDEFVEKEERVAPRWNPSANCSEMVARARAVKQTFLTHVTRHAELAIAACGGRDNVFRLCLHESNPLLVQAVANRLDFPLERVPSISARVGTLAIVSSFSLLARVTAEAEASLAGPGKIVMALIGESYGIRAGHMTLTSSAGVRSP